MTGDRINQVYEVTGDMTFERATEIFALIDMSAIDRDEITVNLAAVNQSDSAALAIMLEWANQAKNYRKKICFSNVPDQLMRLIEMTHLDKILNLVPNS